MVDWKMCDVRRNRHVFFLTRASKRDHWSFRSLSTSVGLIMGRKERRTFVAFLILWLGICRGMVLLETLNQCSVSRFHCCCPFASRRIAYEKGIRLIRSNRIKENLSDGALEARLAITVFLTGFTVQKTTAVLKIQELWCMTSLTDIL